MFDSAIPGGKRGVYDCHCGDAQTPGGDDVTDPADVAGVANRQPGSGSGGASPSGLKVSSPGLASATLAPGTEFGPRYRIESLLGQGGMGAVYKAYDKDRNRFVALKLVRPEFTTDESFMQRIKQELLLASKISHKN